MLSFRRCLLLVVLLFLFSFTLDAYIHTDTHTHKHTYMHTSFLSFSFSLTLSFWQIQSFFDILINALAYSYNFAPLLCLALVRMISSRTLASSRCRSIDDVSCFFFFFISYNRFSRRPDFFPFWKDANLVRFGYETWNTPFCNGQTQITRFICSQSRFLSSTRLVLTFG